MAVGTLLLLLGVFVFGVPLSGTIEHPLPMVKIVKNPEEQSSAETGRVVAREASTTQEAPGAQEAAGGKGWYYFETNETRKPRTPGTVEYRLVSIPDDRVREVHVYDLVNP